MKVEYINPFVSSVQSVFKTMLGLELARGGLYVKDGLQPSHEVSGIIGLSGKAKGTVVLGMKTSLALHVTYLLTGEEYTQIDSHVTDAIGELTNIIVGNAKCQLEALQMSISLPSVISGKNHVIAYPTDSSPIGLPFECEHGTLSLDVSLVDCN
jgi:chemotaxis protein CheX